MPRLQLRLLGPPQVERDGVACDLHSHKALALLAYLAVSDQPHSRAKLATVFWPEQNESRSLAYLRHTLWTLRKSLGNHLFDGEQEWVHIKPSADLWLDVTAFQEHLAACRHAGEMSDEICAAYLPQLAAAVELYSDDFLAGFSLRDSSAFDEWQFFQSEHLRQQLAHALQQLVAGHSGRGNYDAAIPYARRWLALDQLHEPAHQQLMHLYAHSGQRAAAVRQYRECRRILRDELNLAPNAETQALYQQVQSGALSPPQSTLPRAQPAQTPARAGEPAAPALRSTPSQAGAEQFGGVEDELRFVTLLCVGLCRSTTLRADLEDEITLDLLAEQTERLLFLVTQTVAPYQAQVEPATGGAILALFGADSTHEDDPERALHAALAIQHAARQQRLPASIAVSSGMVFVGPHSAGAIQRIVLGSVVTLATRIQARLAPGECAVSKPVYRQTQGIFRFSEHELQLLGQEPAISVYQLQGKQAAPRKVRGIAGLHAQLVGRSEELHTLQTVADHLLHGSGQLVALIGEAGVGKSWLALEFHAQLPRHSAPWLWLEGRCLEMTQGAGYAPFVDLLRTYWGWRPEASDATRAGSIRTVLDELCEDHALHPEQMREIGALLGRLLGLRFENDWDRLLDLVDSHEVQRRTAAALSQFFVALSRRQPLILVIEDLHWANTRSLDLIHLLLERLPDAALLLLCIYRPEQQRRSWQLAASAADKCPGHFCQIDLHELTPDQSRLMVANLLDGSAGDHAKKDAQAELLPPAVQQTILDRAQGNPLYLEELIYSLIDHEMLIRQASGWRAAAEFKLSNVPESLQNIIFSRQDALGSPWKQVLQRAAVIGRTFRRRLLAELTPPDVNLDDALRRLIDTMFVYQERIFPDEEYSFRHVLVQDAIYHGLTQRQQRQLHRQVAQSSEQLAGERLHEQIELLAYHWSQAGEPTQAIRYLLLAGDKAQAALAYHEAADFYRRAVGFLKQQGDQPLTARTLLKLGNSYHSAGEYRHARQAFDDCFALQQQVAAPGEDASTTTATLRLAWGEPDSIDPIATGATIAMAVVQQLFSPLVQMSPAFDVLPAVAQRWEVLQGGRRYIFHLRRDVQWSDGAPLTAYDYALTLRRVLAPTAFDNMTSLFSVIKNGQAYHAGRLTDVTRVGIAVADDHTLIIDLEQPASYFLQSLTCAGAHPTPAHLFAVHGEAWATPGVAVANGPFRLVEWQRGHSMILERNPSFFGQRSGNVDRIELLFDLTIAQQVERYAAEQLDVLWLNDLEPSAREQLRQRHPSEYRTSPLLNVIFAAFDATQPPFTDQRVRQAFVHAIDREALVNMALGGYEQPAHGGVVPSGLPGHSAEIGLGFDAVRARELLQDAGYVEANQFPTVTAFSWHGVAAVCHALSEQWRRQLGLTISWSILDPPEFGQRRFTERPALFLFGFACDYPDANLFLDIFTNTDLTRWSSAEFLRLVAQAQRTLAPAQRLALLSQADAIAMAAAAVMPLYYERLQFLLKPHIRHFPMAPFSWWFWKDVEKMGGREVATEERTADD